MTFLLPLGLLGLLLIPIVALLHLIRQRRERQRVPSLQLWRDLQRQTPEKRPRRLPLTLLLLLHLLLVALLAVALGQPFIETARGAATHTAIIVDTSSSMAATDIGSDRLSEARTEARRIVERMDRDDTAALIELSSQPRIVAQSVGGDRTTLLRELNNLDPAGPDGDMNGALSLAQATAPPDASLDLVVLTDAALRAPENIAVAGELSWRAIGGEGDNTAIVAFAARPLRNGQQQLYARVANLGQTPIARTLRLELDGAAAASEPMRLAPGGEAEWTWPLPQGTERVAASLSGTDVQPLDDRAALVLGGNVRTDVLLVAAAPTPVERALRAQRGVTLQVITPEQYQPDTESDLIVFSQTAPDQLPDAPVLLVAPPAEQEIVPLGDEAEAGSAIEARDDRFGAIDWKPLQFVGAREIVSPAWATVAVADGDVPLVLTGQYNNQPLAVWNFDPAASNLQNRLAFPLLTAATTSTLLPQASDRVLVGATAPFALTGENGERIAAGDRLARPGIYSTDSGAIAVNALDPDESDLRQRPQPTMREIVRPVADNDTPVGRELWQPLVIAGLLLLTFEWLYINRDQLRRRSGPRRGQRARA